MPQGKVIAVKPSYTDSTRSVPQDEGHLFKHQKPKERIVYIGVCNEDGSFKCSRRKVQDIVWFTDLEGEFHVGDIVSFETDSNHTETIDAAVFVKKVGHGGVHLPGNIYAKVAVLATLLLLVTLIKES